MNDPYAKIHVDGFAIPNKRLVRIAALERELADAKAELARLAPWTLDPKLLPNGARLWVGVEVAGGTHECDIYDQHEGRTLADAYRAACEAAKESA